MQFRVAAIRLAWILSCGVSIGGALRPEKARSSSAVTLVNTDQSLSRYDGLDASQALSSSTFSYSARTVFQR